MTQTTRKQPPAMRALPWRREMPPAAEYVLGVFVGLWVVLGVAGVALALCALALWGLS